MLEDRVLTFAFTIGSLASATLAQKTPDVRLDLGDPPGAAPAGEIVLAAEGQSVYCAWIDARDYVFYRWDLYFNRSLDGGATWLPSDVRLDFGSEPGEFCSEQPDIAAVGSRVYVVWQEVRAFTGQVHLGRSEDGGATWAEQIRVDHGNGPGHQCTLIEPKVAASGDAVYVVWQDDRAGQFDVYFNRSLDRGETWLGQDVRLDTGSPVGHKNSWGVQLAASGSEVYAVWYDYRNGSTDIYFNRSLDGGASWLPEDLRLDVGTLAGSSSSRDPRIAESGGSVYVAWIDERNGRSDVYFNRSLDGGLTWLQQDVQLDPGKGPQTADAYGIELFAMDDTVYATWTDKRTGKFQPHFNRSLDRGATWLSSEIRLDVGKPAGSSDSGAPALGVSGSAVWAAWLDQREAPKGTVRLNRSLDRGSTWLPTDVLVNVAPSAGSAEKVRLAATKTGVHVVWGEARHGESDVFYTLASGHQPYGVGKPGTGGVVPTLAAVGDVSIGGDLSIEIEGGLGGATGLLLHTFSGPAAIPVAGGTLLLAPPIHQLPIQLDGTAGAAGTGSASVPVSIPFDLALIGQRVNVQAGLFDPGGVQGTSLTAALEFWVL